MDATALMIRDHYERVRENIDRSAAVARRNAVEVRLVVVTKAQPISAIQAVYEAGARLFGENYPEETLSKIEAMQGLPGIEWHMIGHLQSRKARIIVDHFSMLQSLDSVSLAEKMNRLLAEKGRVLPVLLEVNVGGEDSKGGFPAWREEDWTDVQPEIEQILGLEFLKVIGIMTMPPLFDDPEDARPFFRKARRLLQFLADRYPQTGWKELSMGTSSDYRVAVEEGATYVRVGTAIMGPRPPKG